MEYVQLTLGDWLNIKEKLRKELQGVSEGFIRIGYQLKKIKEQRLYENDGYHDINEFAKAEYGLHPSTVSRFIAINTKYSIDGNSERLRPEFAGMGSTKLAEMLTLPDEDMEMIRPETTKESIRELKRFNRDTPDEVSEEVDMRSTLETIVEEFFRKEPDLLNEIYGEALDLSEMVDRINPSGNRTFRTGLWFVSMFSEAEGLKIKQFGQKPESVTWGAFAAAMDIVFAGGSGKRTWEEHYGEDTEEPVEETEEAVEEDAPAAETPEEDLKESPAEPEDHAGDSADMVDTAEEPETHPETPPEEFAPAQENRINTSAAEGSEEAPEESIEVPQEPEKKIMLMQRRRYIATLSLTDLADYLSRHLSVGTLKDKEELLAWLKMEVEI